MPELGRHGSGDLGGNTISSVMKNIKFLVICVLAFFTFSGCKNKEKVVPALDFYTILGGNEKSGRDWVLTEFYGKREISSYENTVKVGTLGSKYWPLHIQDNYYTFYKNGYGICHEVGVLNPKLEEESRFPEFWDDSLKAYKYIQFTYQSGKTVNIVNRVQKPAFFDNWEIIKLDEGEIVLYQQDKAFNQEFVIVFNRYKAN